MCLKILGLMIRFHGFCSQQSSLTVDTNTAVDSPIFPATGTLGIILERDTFYN
jgi:hypothetical protein